MQSTITALKRLASSGWLSLVLLAAACSLTVPSEDDLFGGSAGSGGQVSNGGRGASGGSDDLASSGLGGLAAPSGDGEGGGDPVNPSGGTGAGSNTSAGGTGATNRGAAGGESSDAGAAGAPELTSLPPAVLAIHYDFENITGGVARDLTENARNGQILGLVAATPGTGHLGNALMLSAAQKQYVKLPNDILVGEKFVSVAIWFKLTSRQSWDRLFDFNTAPAASDESSTNWFYFSPSGWNDSTRTFGSRCASLSSAGLAEFVLETSVPTTPASNWHHVTVVFGQPFLRYYLDGVQQGELLDLRFGPDALGKTDQNFIGRAGYPSDPYLNAQIDDFRFYSGVLTATEIEQLAAE